MQQILKCTCHKITVLWRDLYQHDNMTSNMLHETLWNMRILAAQRGRNDKNGPSVAACDFLVIFCAVFTQALISRSSHWVHIQSRWSCSRDEMKLLSKLQSKPFDWGKNILLVKCNHTMSQICQSSHVKHAFESIFHALAHNQELKDTHISCTSVMISFKSSTPCETSSTNVSEFHVNRFVKIWVITLSWLICAVVLV